MVDDELTAVPEPPDARSWTGQHRSGTSRRGRSAIRRDRPPPEADPVDEPPADGEEASAVGTAVVRPRSAVDLPEREPLDEHAWLDHDAGPVVRPYTLTGGRSRPFTSGLGLLTYVESLYAPDADLVALQPEHRSILSLTRTALSLAEVAARLDLPVGVVRVLVGDLIQANLVSTFDSDAAIRAPDDHVLQAVLDGLRSL
jgi:hypothetical protein